MAVHSASDGEREVWLLLAPPDMADVNFSPPRCLSMESGVLIAGAVYRCSDVCLRDALHAPGGEGCSVCFQIKWSLKPLL